MSNEERLRWDLAGYFGDSGESRISALQGHPEILVPPRVDIVKVHDARARALGFEDPDFRALRYPVPEDMPLPMTETQVRALLNAGWKARASTSALLEEFLQLAELGNDSPIQPVQSFAAKWGPLWVCRGEGYDHTDCHWSMQGGVRQHDPCSWINTERAEAFVVRAKEAKAALDAGAALKDGKPIPDTLLKTLGLGYPWLKDRIGQYGVEAEKTLFCEVVNRYLGLKAGGPGIYMTWEGAEPRLDATSGFGFIRAVWLGIAQTFTGVRKLYTCDECKRPYPRQMRKPRKGGRNLCPSCGKADGYRGAKRRWWDSARGRTK